MLHKLFTDYNKYQWYLLGTLYNQCKRVTDTDILLWNWILFGHFKNLIDNYNHKIQYYLAIELILLYFWIFDILRILFFLIIFIHTKCWSLFSNFFDRKSLNSNWLSLSHQNNMYDDTIIWKSPQFEKTQGKARAF